MTGRPRTDFGLPSDSWDSFLLSPEDTVHTVADEHRSAVERSHRAVDGVSLDTVLTGHRFGPLPLRWVYLHVLREIAQHRGHAEILREQILAARDDPLD